MTAQNRIWNNKIKILKQYNKELEVGMTKLP